MESTELQRVAFAQEPAGAANFGIDITGSATFLDMPIQGIATATLNWPTHDPEIQKQRKDEQSPKILGVKSAELTVTFPIGGTGVPAGDGADSPAHVDQALLLFLKVAYGGASDSNTGSAVASATNEYTLVADDPAAFDGGECIGWVNPNGGLEARVVTAGGAGIVLRDGFSAVPADDDVLHAGTTIYPTENPLTSMQLLVEGAEPSDRWLLKGGQVTGPPSITIALGEIATISFTLTFADWDDEPAAAISMADYGTFEPVLFHSARIVDGASPAGVCIDAASIGLTFNGPVYGAAKAACGVNTVKRWVRKVAPPMAAAELTVPFEDLAWFAAREARSYYGLYFQFGNVPGRTILIEIPNAQIDEVNRADAESIAYQTLKFESTIDAFVDASADNDDIRFAAVRIHFL